MSEINTGGPAFPPSNPGYAHGMTLRDYFAAKAMKTYSDDTDEQLLENARQAYAMADAMMKAREA